MGLIFDYKNIYIHIDKKSDISVETVRDETSHKVTILKKYAVYWGGYSQLISILELIKIAKSSCESEYMILMSGQDMPIVSWRQISQFLDENPDRSFIDCFEIPDDRWNYLGGMGRLRWYWFMDYVSRMRGIQRFQNFSHRIFEKYNISRKLKAGWRFFGGSDWWILPSSVASYCQSVFENDGTVRTMFKHSFIPTEMYFQTVIMNSRYSKSIYGSSLRYTHWGSRESSHPAVITTSMIEDIDSSSCLFARKFDTEHDPVVFNYYRDIFLRG